MSAPHSGACGTVKEPLSTHGGRAITPHGSDPNQQVRTSVLYILVYHIFYYLSIALYILETLFAICKTKGYIMLSKEQILILNEWQALYFHDDNMPEYGYIYKKECIKDHKISTFYTIELHIIPETGCWLINVFYNNIECICNCVEDNAHSIPRFKRDIDYKSFLREIEIRQYSNDVISFIKDTVQQLQHLQTDENQDKLKKIMLSYTNITDGL